MWCFFYYQFHEFRYHLITFVTSFAVYSVHAKHGRQLPAVSFNVDENRLIEKGNLVKLVVLNNYGTCYEKIVLLR